MNKNTTAWCEEAEEQVNNVNKEVKRERGGSDSVKKYCVKKLQTNTHLLGVRVKLLDQLGRCA